MNLMVDIETLGVEPGCSILSVGAVEFGPRELGLQFHEQIDLVSCESAGLQIDADTVQWWATKDNVADVFSGGRNLENVLIEFGDVAADAETLWANSPQFDLSILRAAYDAVGLDTPWSFYQERDFRTLKNLPVAVDIDHEGTEHDALDDAIHQAHVASATFGQMDADIDRGPEDEK